MSSNIGGALPSMGSFGLSPDVDLVDIDAEDFDNLGLQAEDVPLQLGRDLMYDFGNATFDPSGGNWIRVCGEAQALFQWIHVALTTPKGRSLLYPASFGSEISDILALGLQAPELAAELPGAVRDALLQHDRIEAIEDFNLRSHAEGALELTFRVILDDDAVLAFEMSLPFGS